ncbi:hypothetical protein [Thalassomonas actiniarum]|uniref:Uncharacterized protein n=1 Tax=Thalassomonas actiniarum TaxID=485447 RepID=A0AAF0C261_9GAMM|nr:hypothetical protein [Thalassomonas actiniarum]WDD97419.1 hypothetical protein SG35_019135 [Thalassomonas actiniarum]
MTNNAQGSENKTRQSASGAQQASGQSSSAKGFSLPALRNNIPPDSSQNPLTSLREIAKDKDIDPEIRQWLFDYAVTRFTNRRKMAYLALLTIIGIVIFLGFGAIYDGTSECVMAKTCNGILASVKEVDSVLVWVVGFLASIVAAYYGVSSFRPSS